MKIVIFGMIYWVYHIKNDGLIHGKSKMWANISDLDIMVSPMRSSGGVSPQKPAGDAESRQVIFCFLGHAPREFHNILEDEHA